MPGALTEARAILNQHVYSGLLNRVILPGVLPLTRSRLLHHARRTREQQYWPAERMTAWQFQQIRQMVTHAATHVPFYRERFAEAGIAPERIRTLDDLRRIPLTTKQDIQENFPDRIVAESLRDEDWQYVGTRGTTNRVMVIQDFEKRDQGRGAELVAMTEDCAYDWGKPMVFIPPDACNVLCGVDGMRETSVLRHLAKMTAAMRLRDPGAVSDLRGLVMNNWIQRSTILEPFGAEGTHIADDRLSAYFARLRQFSPVLLKALPEYLDAFARYAQRTGDRPPSIPVVKPMGADMCASVKRRAGKAFGGEVREDYGSLELGSMAFDCKERNGLHLLQDQFYFEFVRRGERVADGELAGVLVTDLHNRAMPLIRYAIGDVVRVDRTACPCGRQTPRIVTEGRLEDTIVTRSGRVLTADAVCEFFFNQPGIDEFQLVERRADRWELKYVCADGGPDLRELAVRFQQFSGDSRTLRMRETRSVAPEPSGKFRHVKSSSYDRFDA